MADLEIWMVEDFLQFCHGNGGIHGIGCIDDEENGRVFLMVVLWPCALHRPAHFSNDNSLSLERKDTRNTERT